MEDELLQNRIRQIPALQVSHVVKHTITKNIVYVISVISSVYSMCSVYSIYICSLCSILYIAYDFNRNGMRTVCTSTYTEIGVCIYVSLCTKHNVRIVHIYEEGSSRLFVVDMKYVDIMFIQNMYSECICFLQTHIDNAYLQISY